MITALLGAPNAGKTTLARRYVGALYMPVHFVRVAASRLDTDRLRGGDWHDLLQPAEFVISSARGLPDGDRLLVDALCAGETHYQQSADVALAAGLFDLMRRRWAAYEVIAEGEILARPEWLRALRPDRVQVLLWDVTRGCVRDQRRRGVHPPAEWTDETYLKAQLDALDVAARWTRGEL